MKSGIMFPIGVTQGQLFVLPAPFFNCLIQSTGQLSGSSGCLLGDDAYIVFDDPKVFDFPQVFINLKVILDENINCDGPKEFDDPK